MFKSNFFTNALKWLRIIDQEAGDAIIDNQQKLELAIHDAEEQYNRATSQTVNVLASIKQDESDLAVQEKRKETLTKIAKRAAEAGNEADVRQTVTSIAEVNAKIESIKTQIAYKRATLEDLKADLEAARAKIEEASNMKDTLLAQHETAKLTEAANDAQLGFHKDNLGSALDELKNQVEGEMNKAAAAKELVAESAEGTEASLVEKYSGKNEAIDAEVQRLMDKAAEKKADTSSSPTAAAN